MSSEADVAANDDKCCASCGIAANDNIKLKNCTACHLVKYCGVKCQREHRSKHKRECKKRAAELHDEILFKQPESSHHGDCPICCLPLPIDQQKSGMMTCCSKQICKGCCYANAMREIRESLEQKCPFCRYPLQSKDEDFGQNLMRRAEANDPVAMREMGKRRRNEGDYGKAFEYWKKAAELGDSDAHFQISVFYQDGKGGEKDVRKAIYHAEQAAIGGHPRARFYLGYEELRNRRIEKAMKHLIIAAKLGHDASLKSLRDHINIFVSEEDFAAALRAHQAAVDATKSPQRVAGEAFYAKHQK